MKYQSKNLLLLMEPTLPRHQHGKDPSPAKQEVRNGLAGLTPFFKKAEISHGFFCHIFSYLAGWFVEGRFFCGEVSCENKKYLKPASRYLGESCQNSPTWQMSHFPDFHAQSPLGELLLPLHHSCDKRIVAHLPGQVWKFLSSNH